MAAASREKRACVVCGREFEANQWKKKTCGKECSRLLRLEGKRRHYSKHREAIIARRHPPPMERKCSVCGRAFIPRNSQAKNCSKGCSAASRRERSRCSHEAYSPEKKREWAQRYRQKNIDKIRERDSRYAKANREKKTEQHRRWCEANREHLREYSRLYRQKNIDRIRIQERTRRLSNLDEINARHRAYMREYTSNPENRRRVVDRNRRHHATRLAARRLGLPPLLYAALKIQEQLSQSQPGA